MRFLTLLIPMAMFIGCKNNGQQTEPMAKETKQPKQTKQVLRSIITDASLQHSEKDVDFTVTSWDISGDTLIVGVQHGGGCREHDWKMYSNGAVLKSLPPQAILHLKHEVKDGPDPCRAIIRETLKFNLATLKPLAAGKLVVKWSSDDKRSATYAF